LATYTSLLDTLTDTNRDSIEKRSGRWLKDLARQNQLAGFDLNAWIAAWEAGGRQIPGRN